MHDYSDAILSFFILSTSIFYIKRKKKLSAHSMSGPYLTAGRHFNEKSYQDSSPCSLVRLSLSSVFFFFLNLYFTRGKKKTMEEGERERRTDREKCSSPPISHANEILDGNK